MKKKLLTLILGCVMALSVVAIGVYALTTVNLGVTGSISFIAYDKQVYIEDITLKNIVEETDTGYQTTSKSFEDYQGVYLKNSNSTVDLSGKVLQGETMEIDITLKNLKANYLKTSLSHKALPTGVLIRSTGLYMPQNTGTSAATGESRTLKIYISNQSTTTYTLDLSTVDLSIAFSEVESLIHTGTRTEGETTKTIYYVEMGTLPGTEAVDGVYTEQYLKWIYISADGETAYTANAAPTNVGGTYILETDVKGLTRNNSILRHDAVEESYLGLCDVNFNNDYTGRYNKTTSSYDYRYNKAANVNANDYALSDVRKYMNGEKVYKTSSYNNSTKDENGKTIYKYTPNTTGHYSDMLTDFCIDVENDLIYNRIIARTLSDMYEDIWDCPEAYTAMTEEQKAYYAQANGYDMGEADKFWAPSYTEALNLLCNGTWATNSAVWNTPNSGYWLRSPYADDSRDAYCVSNYGNCVDSYVNYRNCAARAAFTLA